MRLNIRKRSRGMSGLFETVACLILASMLIVSLLSIMAATTVTTRESQQTIIDKMNTDFLVEVLQTDVKSAVLAEVVDNQLQLIVDNSVILYRADDDTLYRNDEVALTNVRSCSFISEDGDSVGIYIAHGYDEIIDLMIVR